MLCWLRCFWLSLGVCAIIARLLKAGHCFSFVYFLAHHSSCSFYFIDSSYLLQWKGHRWQIRKQSRELRSKRLYVTLCSKPSPVAARSKLWLCGRSLAVIVGSNPAGGMRVPLLWVLCCQVEDSATDRSLVQMSSTECSVSENDHEISTRRNPCPTRAVEQYIYIEHVYK